MMDQLKSIIIRQRARQAVALGLIVFLAISASIFEFWPRTYVTDGQFVEATVVRVGTYPVSGAYGGDLAILTIRLPNGSIRQVRASWSTAGKCMTGSQI